MDNRYDKKTWILGAAIALGLAKILTNRFQPKRRWTDEAQEIGSDLWEELREWGESHLHIPRINLLAGTLAGGLVGVLTALLTAPKPGKELIEDLTEAFQSNGSSRYRSFPRRISKAATSRSKASKISPIARKTVRSSSTTHRSRTKSSSPLHSTHHTTHSFHPSAHSSHRSAYSHASDYERYPSPSSRRRNTSISRRKMRDSDSFS